MKKDLAIIILAYNDSPSLPLLVAGIDDTLRKLSENYEIVVVDDGSKDGSKEVIGLLESEFSSLRSVFHQTNKGVGAAFASGLRASDAEVVGYIDGDGQYEPTDFLCMFEALGGADIVSGVRVKRADPWFRTVISFIYGGLLRVVFNLQLKDVNSGIKLYRRSLFEAIGTPSSIGAFYDAEIAIKALHEGMRLLEIPVSHYPRLHGIAGGVTLKSILSAFVPICDPLMDSYRSRSLSSRLTCSAILTVSAASKFRILPS